MRLMLSGAAPLVLSVSAAALLASAPPALAGCTTTGTISFTIACGGDFGPNATATPGSGTLTIDDLRVDDPSNGANSFSRVVLKAGDESTGAIDIGLELTGETYVDSHNSAAVYGLTKKGDITITIGEDVELHAQQSGVFAKADNSGSTAGGNVSVTNYGTIEAGMLLDQSLGSEGIRVRALQGEGTIYNYGSVTSQLGRGLRIDGSKVAGSAGDLIVNYGTVESELDAMHINGDAGDATLENHLGAVALSHGGRGAVAASKSGAASFSNDGEITSLSAAGALVWGAKNAAAVNTGAIVAKAADGDGTNDFLNFGVQIWSQDEGDASLVNRAGGSIIAHDGWAAWLLSADGDVTIDNAGTLLGKSTAVYVGADKIKEQYNENPELPDYDGAVGGDLTLTNSGTITADTTTDGTGGMGLITLIGHDLDDVSVTNLAAGFIGAGFVDGTVFTLGALQSRSVADLGDIGAAASNLAISLGVAADSSTIINQGTLVGRVAVASPFDVFGASAPTSSSPGSMANGGLWVTSGASGYRASLPGTISNTGDIFTLGETSLTGKLENSGTLWIRAAGDDAAYLTVTGDYAASGDAAFVFDLKADGNPLVNVTGAISGQTQVILANLDGWDWKSYVPHVLIDTADASSERGADSFVLAAPVVGLVQYNLDYDAGAYSWSLGTEVSQQSVTQGTEAAQTVATSLASVSSDLLNRTDDLRDSFWGPSDTVPMSYFETKMTPAEAAVTGLAPASQQTSVRSWSKAYGAFGTGSGYNGRQGSVSFGTDVTSEQGDGLVAIGAFGALTGTRLDYAAAGSGADITGRAVGAYGTAVNGSGLFASGVVALQASDTQLVLAGEAAQFDAWTAGGRVDVGYRSQLGEVAVEPSLGLRLGATRYDDFNMSGSTVSIDDAQESAAEARLRLSQSFAHETMDVTTFGILTLGASRSADGAMSLSDVGAVGTVDNTGLYGGLALGVQSSSLDGRATGYARADIAANEDSRWVTFKLGSSYKF